MRCWASIQVFVFTIFFSFIFNFVFVFVLCFWFQFEGEHMACLDTSLNCSDFSFLFQNFFVF
jgi:hypothetical protein